MTLTNRWFQIERAKLNGAISRAKAGKLFVQPTSQFRCYVVSNRESGTRYIVTFALGENGAKLGRCSCPSLTICKHIAAALPLHVHIASNRTRRNQLAAV